MLFCLTKKKKLVFPSRLPLLPPFPPSFKIRKKAVAASTKTNKKDKDKDKDKSGLSCFFSLIVFFSLLEKTKKEMKSKKKNKKKQNKNKNSHTPSPFFLFLSLPSLFAALLLHLALTSAPRRRSRGPRPRASPSRPRASSAGSPSTKESKNRDSPRASRRK